MTMTNTSQIKQFWLIEYATNPIYSGFMLNFIPANESELELAIFRISWQCRQAWGHLEGQGLLQWPKACLEIPRDCNLSQQCRAPCKS